MKIRSALLSITTALATLIVLPQPAAIAAPSRGLSVELGYGAEVVTTVELKQGEVRDFSLPYLRQVRADMYDRNVPFQDSYNPNYRGLLRDVVAAYGLTRDQYVNGLSWSGDMERIAVQRAVEEKYSGRISHARANFTSMSTATLPGGIKASAENLCQGHTTVERCLEALTYGEEHDLRQASGRFTSASGHLHNILNPYISYVGMGAVDRFYVTNHSPYPSIRPAGTDLEGLTVLSIAVPEKDIRSDFSLDPFSTTLSPGHSTVVVMRNHNGFDLPGTITTTDTDVISIDRDIVTALDYGTATITFRSDDGRFTDSTTITVADPPSSSLSNLSSGSS